MTIEVGKIRNVGVVGTRRKNPRRALSSQPALTVSGSDDGSTTTTSIRRSSGNIDQHVDRYCDGRTSSQRRRHPIRDFIADARAAPRRRAPSFVDAVPGQVRREV